MPDVDTNLLDVDTSLIAVGIALLDVETVVLDVDKCELCVACVVILDDGVVGSDFDNVVGSDLTMLYSSPHWLCSILETLID